MSRNLQDGGCTVPDSKLGMNGRSESAADKSDDGDDSDEEGAVEESPCGRWFKRREQVQQRNVPGIDNAYLAMDSEEGVEVVWNEIYFSEEAHSEAQEQKLRRVFDNLIQLDYPNIVKFHKYWQDKANDKPRIIFISEYMSCGSLNQFLKKTKNNLTRLPLQSWKRWCAQIASALSYLHSCSPPIIHGNLSCDTIFIQHNGLIKIGSVAPDIIYECVAASREDAKNKHFVPPECCENNTKFTTAGDIYSFGMCALEMAVLEIQSHTTPVVVAGNGHHTEGQVSDEQIRQALDLVGEEDPLQKDFISRCLERDPADRPTARQLLFHPILFEVHSLKLLAAHCLVYSAKFSPELVTEEAVHNVYGKDRILAEIRTQEGTRTYSLSDMAFSEKLETFMEDVQFGIYPLTAYAIPKPNLHLNDSTDEGGFEDAENSVAGAGVSVISEILGHSRLARSDSNASEGSQARNDSKPDPEMRRIRNMLCTMKTKLAEGEIGHKPIFSLSILLRLEDQMNRLVTCDLNDDDTALSLAAELVELCLILKEDELVVRDILAEMMENMATGCTTTSCAILDKTDIPNSFTESGLLKDFMTSFVPLENEPPSIVPVRAPIPSSLPAHVLDSFDH